MSTLFAPNSSPFPESDDIRSNASRGRGVGRVQDDRPPPPTATPSHRDGGHDGWPLYPFNVDRDERTPPNPTLLKVACVCIPEFDPDNDPLAWRLLGEFVRVWSGRTAEDMLAMTQDDTIVVLRAWHAWSHGPQDMGVAGRIDNKRQGGKERGRRSNRPEADGSTVDDRLRKFALERPCDAVGLSLAELGREIGCSKSAFSRSPFYNDRLNPQRRKRARRGVGAEVFDAEDGRAIRDYRDAEDERDLIDKRLDAETGGRSRPNP